MGCRPRLFVVITAFALGACDHSAAPTVPEYTERGTGNFAGLGADAVWTEDGTGLLFTSTCLTNQTAKGPLFAAALSVLPAGGGSISWQRCEHAHSNQVPADSLADFWAAALATDGRLLYLESVTDLQGLSKQIGKPPVTFPGFTDAALWLTDSAFPLSRRRKLLSLYRVDTTGVKTIPDDQVDWLVNLAWTGQQTFVALGANLSSRLGSYQPRPLRVVHGTIGASTTSLAAIPGTEGARAYSLAEGNATIVFLGDSGRIERVPIDGGAATTVATVPTLVGRSFMDISCKSELCLVLTQEIDANGRIQSTFWNVSLATGALTAVGTSPTVYRTAKISPRSNTVVASGSILAGLVH